MIPNNITSHHIIQAIEDYNTNGIRFSLAKSKRYHLLYKNRFYPPKYIVSVANEFANGKYLSHRVFNTYQAQNFLTSLSNKFSIDDNQNIQPASKQIKKTSSSLNVMGAFVFRDEGDGCLVAKYIEHNQLTPYTESAKSLPGPVALFSFEGKYNTAWVEHKTPFASCEIHIVKTGDIYRLKWSVNNSTCIYEGTAMLFAGNLVGCYWMI